MATTTLKTRIVLNNKTAAEWAENASFVALKGEVLLEVDTRKIKVGLMEQPHTTSLPM